MIVAVSDLGDERLQAFLAVGDPELARRDGVFVAEGREVVRRVLRSRAQYRVRSLLVSGATRAALGGELDTLAPDVLIFEAPRGLAEQVTGFNIHRGCLALVERPSPRDWRQVAADAGPGALVVLEDVGNPDNVGGVFRNARAFGAGGVLMNGGCSDPLYRKAIRTSMGASLEVPFAEVSPWPQALDDLRSLGFHVLALVPRAATRLDERLARLTPGTGVALLAGHEGHGLSGGVRAAADAEAGIPLAPGADSLNVSVAVAVALHELLRAGITS
jgi:tRNA G18 (ribose-2'-O)-methylase SpoU